MLKTTALTKSYGALRVTDALNLDIEEGELRAIIGPNGAGKTSLIGQLSGEMASDAGQVHFNGVDVTHASVSQRCRLGMARTYQITSLLHSFSVLDNVRTAVLGVSGHSFHFFRRLSAESKVADRAMQALSAVGLESRSDMAAGELGYGEQRQLEIAMAIVSQPKLLLLDEPTAGMGAEDSGRIKQLVNGLKRKMTIILVEHDMDTVFTLADRISVLAQGREILTGSVEQIRTSAAVREHYLGEDHAHA